jgi:hypothetical protein
MPRLLAFSIFQRFALGAAACLAVFAGWTGPAGSSGRLSSREQTTPESISAPEDTPSTWQRAQHLGQLGVDRWHEAGVRGQGLKIAVLDTGFRGYRSFLGKVLPSRVTTRSFRKDGDLEARDSQHGILCGEVIHALAPAAELLFANWESEDSDSFLAAVRWAKEQGARIISCSVIMPSWSDGEGNGPVHAVLSRLLGSGRSTEDLLCFASAGNIAQRHWSGSYCPDPAGCHQWAKGKTANSLAPWGRDRVSVELYGPGTEPLELEVRDGVTGDLVGSARTGRQPGARSAAAVVRFHPHPAHNYQVCLKGDGQASSKSDKFHLVVLGGSLDRWTARGSIPFPADGQAVQAVGAVDGEHRRLFYSSCGPNSRTPKPDFVAPVPFPSLWRERPFAGTSAAAPQAAALAALVWSRNPEWTPARVSESLRQTARDLGQPGHDCETGYGLVRLP